MKELKLILLCVIIQLSASMPRKSLNLVVMIELSGWYKTFIQEISDIIKFKIKDKL